MAISAATLRMSDTGGKREAEESLSAGEFSARACAAASIIALVTRRAPEATSPSPMAGKMKTLLHWAIGIVLPANWTGGKGEPVAIRARPSVQRIKSSGFASDLMVGLESGKIMGR